MIISKGRGYIFVHIPKTGGTSLALALESRAMKDDLMLGDTPKASKRRKRLSDAKTAGRLWKHSTLADIEGLVLCDEIAQMFTFTLVRNPWDRIVSYYHWLRDQSFDHAAVVLAGQVDFGTFLNTPFVQESLQAAPYGYYLRDSLKQEHCKLFIRVEHFAQDAAPLFDHLGFNLTLPHKNTSNRRLDYREYYTVQTRNLVAGLCAEDIARFGYRFDA
ncbi:MAG TPA: Type II secretory pathway, pullulanase PulA [Roseobacter sp.]|nr:Type II secretory pathway, pullulanase PulA [Roseobacter sp.]